jgi:alpha-methylacyl-CoA racemase
MAAQGHGALAGVRVIELGGIGPGPFAAMVLADHGADVVRIDRPGAAPQNNALFARGKRGIELDLKSPQGREQVLRLVDRADALIEGFRPGVAQRMGFGPDECRVRNPRLVYGQMTGFGQTGPLAAKGGHDINYIAVAGALEPFGRAGGPPVQPLNILGDFAGGGLLMAFGITLALFEARHSGLGQVVDAAMIDGAALLMNMYHHPAMKLGPRGTNRFDSGAPFYNVYETRDGLYMSVGATAEPFYGALLRGLDLANDDLPGREDTAGWPVLRERFARAFKTRTQQEWVEVFDELDACAEPVLKPQEAHAHPHHRARGTFQNPRGFYEPAPAPRLGRTPGRIRTDSPLNGGIEAVLAAWSER